MARTRRTYTRPISSFTPGITAGEIILLIREWFDVHGEPPRAKDWSPWLLRREEPRAYERFCDGGWPTAAVVAQHFGNFTGGIIAAGLYPRQATEEWRGLSLTARSPYLRRAVVALKAAEKEA